MNKTLFCIMAVLAVLSFRAHADDHTGVVFDDTEVAVPGGSKAVPFDRNDKAPPFRGTARETADYSLSGVATALASRMALLLPPGFEFDGGAGNPCAMGATMCVVEGVGGTFVWRGIRRVAADGTDASGIALVCAAVNAGDGERQCADGVLQRVDMVAPGTAAEDADEHSE